MPKRSGKSRLSRRRFLSMVAAAAAATTAAPARAVVAAVPPRTKRADRLSAKIQAEIAKQKKFVAGALETIRKYELPPGSDMAFVFRPVRPRRRT